MLPAATHRHTWPKAITSSTCCLSTPRRYFRVPSLATAAAMLERTPPAAPGSRALGTLDPGDAYYLLNPDGDLAPTQRAFEGWFQSMEGWEVRGEAAGLIG